MEKINKILGYWFGGLNDQIPIQKNSPIVKKWFTKSNRTDKEIKEEFGDDLIKAKNGQYKDWEQTPKGRLALIILFDQFSRNIYRGTPKAFENHPPALDLTLRTMNETMY